MQHIYYFDGNKEKISWVIESENKTYQEIRIHPRILFQQTIRRTIKICSFTCRNFLGNWEIHNQKHG